MLSLIIINTSFIICIACIHQPSIEIYIETAVIRTFVVHDNGERLARIYGFISSK